MRKLNQIKHFFLTLLAVMLIFSCSSDEQIDTKPEFDESVNFVSSNEVSKIASTIEYPLSIDSKNDDLRARGITSISKKIKNITNVPDENGKTSYYIINYENEGFVMIAADNRASPILAYSENSNFSLKENELTAGLVEWLSNTKDYIKNVRNENKKRTKSQSLKWKPSEIQKNVRRIPPDEGPGSCQNTYKTVGPLLKTNWHQRSGFNNYMPTMSCSNNLPNGKAYAGCVPVAMAQIMKYHKYPTRYDWNSMPNNEGSDKTSLLIKDIHYKIANMYGGSANPLKYKCDGTGVRSGANMGIVLTRDFGFKSAIKSDYNRDIIVRELNNNRPVILSGAYKSGGWWIFSSYSGHMWVCDGFRRTMIYSDDCQNGWGYLYLHMNWGWGKYSHNGWFSFNNFNPGNHTYNERKKMIYNIKP
jgi:hypothetical protein